MSVPALKNKLDELLVEYKTLQERNNILKKSYLNKGFENNSKTMQFFINTFGYTRDFDNKNDLHSSCIIDRILTTDDVDNVTNFKRKGVLRVGIKQLREPCGLENKNVRDTDTGSIGFVASDGTLQIYPDGTDVTKTTFDNCPTHEPNIDVKFSDFATKNDLTKENPCKVTLENPLLVEMNRVYNSIKQTFEMLKREMKNQPVTSSIPTNTSDESLKIKIDEFKKMNKEFKETQSDVTTLDSVESVADTMRIFSFYRIFLWAFLALLGFSLVYSISKNGGKMSITSSMIIGAIICTIIYMNMYIIKKLFQNI